MSGNLAGLLESPAAGAGPSVIPSKVDNIVPETHPPNQLQLVNNLLHTPTGNAASDIRQVGSGTDDGGAVDADVVAIVGENGTWDTVLGEGFDDVFAGGGGEGEVVVGIEGDAGDEGAKEEEREEEGEEEVEGTHCCRWCLGVVMLGCLVEVAGTGGEWCRRGEVVMSWRMVLWSYWG